MKNKVRTRKKINWWENFKRLIVFRLIVPIKRSYRQPKFSARGSMVGLVWAFTPLIGLQMYLCFMTWLITRKLFKWDFSLPIACAWTWTTNIFTLIPIYYAFYITGYCMLGFHSNNVADYASFARLFQEALFSDPGVRNTLKVTLAVAKKSSLCMAVGCLPYMAIFGWLGYRYTFKYASARQERQGRKRSS
ncbi:hypothetical protein FACS1894204_03550 [Synergistales bacterium]|nr:hypothetical protein FACS1894204_03550 [Synergistales bacterium]